jgi:tape measure domain-containing protein
MPSRNITLIVRAMGATQAARQLNTVSNSLGNVGVKGRGATRSINSVSGALGAFNRTAQTVTVRAATGVAAVGVAAAVTGVKFNAMMERQTTAFEGFLGSASAARGYVQDLYTLAAKTPFQFEDVLKGTRTLAAYGMEAQEAKGLFEDMANAIAATGGGQDEIRRATIGLGQMQATGIVHAQDLNQLIQAGIISMPHLAERMGTTNKKFRDEMKKGNVQADDFFKAMREGWRNDPMYQGAAAKQADTFYGQLEKLRDFSKQTMGIITEPLFLSLRNKVLPAAADLTQELNKIWRRPELKFEDKLRISWRALRTKVEPLLDDLSGWWRSNHVGSMMSRGFEAALTNAGNAIPGVAATLATSFWDAFWSMGTKGKTVTALFILTKLGMTTKVLGAAGSLLWGLLWGGKSKGGTMKGAVMNVTAGVVNVNQGIPGRGVPGGKAGKTGILRRALPWAAGAAASNPLSAIAAAGAIPAGLAGWQTVHAIRTGQNHPGASRAATGTWVDAQGFPTSGPGPGHIWMPAGGLRNPEAGHRRQNTGSMQGVLGHLQGGGYVNRSGVYEVGERGRERVYLPQGSTVTPNQEPVHITSNLVVDGKVLATAVNRAVLKKASTR